MPKIKQVKAREILDSRGWPTIEVEIFLDGGASATASVPAGSLTLGQGAQELRDGDQKRYDGRGVLRAIAKIEEVIAPAIIGGDWAGQKELDEKLIALDGTDNKKNLGANSILAVSLAYARAAALAGGQELFVYLREEFKLAAPRLPRLMFNAFNGGGHADTNLDFQEFLTIPRLAPAAEMIRSGAEVFHELGRVLEAAGYDTDTGQAGGYAPDMDSSIEAMELILAAALQAGYQPGQDLDLGLDIGSAMLYDTASKDYIFPLDNASFSTSNLIGLYDSWLKKYPLIYLEDGLAPEAWAQWRELTAELGGKMTIAGDDLFMTDINRLRTGLKEQAASGIVIKPNQAGTLTETVDCIRLAQKHAYRVIVSQRSGETNDDFIADLAIACGADFLKAGAPTRGERLAKYNRCLKIASLIEKK